VGGTVSGWHTLVIGRRVRDALEQKAGKYGSIDMPFVIAVYGAGEWPVRTSNEFNALFGGSELRVPTKGVGKPTWGRKPDGFFVSVREGKRHHEHVSAVLFYRFKWQNNGHEHQMHVYHNPFALKPLRPDLFPGIPQFVGDGEKLEWRNGKPE
ncbi:MAG: hypothetical protein AAB037_02650, partial [Chloroflexota bacterium]